MRARSLTLVVFSMAMASIATFARAGQPQAASGTAQVTTFTPTSTRQAGDNTLVEGIWISTLSAFPRPTPALFKATDAGFRVKTPIPSRAETKVVSHGLNGFNGFNGLGTNK